MLVEIDSGADHGDEQRRPDPDGLVVLIHGIRVSK
jgi:hypothetical protein